MQSYEIEFRIDPPYIFGIRTYDMEVAPAFDLPSMNFAPDMETLWLTRPDGTSTERREGEMFEATMVVDSVEFNFFDAGCRAVVFGINPDDSVQHAKSVLDRMLRTFTATTNGVGAILTSRVVKVFSDGRQLRRNVTPFEWFHVYDNDRMAAEFTKVVSDAYIAASDHRLEKSFAYIAVGDGLNTIQPRQEDSSFGAEILPLRYLQYFKAITVIIGDPSKDKKTYQSRPRQIGLDKNFVPAVLLPLKKVRDSLDVAHSIDFSEGNRVSEDQVQQCRDTATMVVRKYIEHLKTRLD